MWPATGAGDGGGQVALRELQLQIDRTPQRPARRDEVELDSPMLAAAQRRRAQQVRAVEQRWHPARAEGLRLPLVRAIARRCTSRGEDLDDLVQGGAERLIRASARFGPGPWRRLRDVLAPAIGRARPRTQLLAVGPIDFCRAPMLPGPVDGPSPGCGHFAVSLPRLSGRPLTLAGSLSIGEKVG
jgi:hypothetical protein